MVREYKECYYTHFDGVGSMDWYYVKEKQDIEWDFLSLSTHLNLDMNFVKENHTLPWS